MRSQCRLGAIKATAYHEAGHAVMAYDRNIGIGTVTVEPHDDCLGHVSVRIPRWLRPDIDLNPRTRSWIEGKIIVSLAGQEAERLVSRRYNTAGASGDYETARELAAYVCSGDEEVEAYLRWLAVRAKARVNTPRIRVGIEAVAEALVERRALKATEVTSLIREAIQQAAGARSNPRAVSAISPQEAAP